ncbi:uncharacterized protein [Euwallacea fornicatus]|uniref:uncharacterized protein n=1 Tax=Euwallacea fornicatus TaxID=995702 RepID=UPI0033901C35
MRLTACVHWGLVVIFVLETSLTVSAKGKYDIEEPNNNKNKKAFGSGDTSKSNTNKKTKDFNDIEDDKIRAKKYEKTSKTSGQDSKKSNETPQKKFIGRIEHGKVMVLRRKDDSVPISKSSDQRNDVCTKSKNRKYNNCHNGKNPYSEEESQEESSEEETLKGKAKKHVKYSIKFRHEKQKKKENGDIRIMRLHKNGRKNYEKEDEDSGEDEDEPIKRFKLLEDDD